ncbi:hypothetical protein [Amycolatopsis sp. 195334CR]|uniref:hypothetical protein n=1 Tax=Amycolatopsis sp. 195334CR TaxID=2814588 RepID=UPI001A8CFB42|nr:hypothetical protein [Amycolatopsis sp. 195334CR]MBN6040697.1 hypothetical protein [Amycolatopsis sp. 195334CR]
MSEQNDELSHRALAMLRAVGERRAMMSGSCEPDLFIDGFACCDQVTAHTLAHRGYLRPAETARPGTRVRAELTPAGWAALGMVAAA